MGANLAIFGFADNIKTKEAAMKDFDRRADEDRYENGHSYSGGIGMLHLRYVNRVFDTLEDFEAMFMDGGPYSDKGEGVLCHLRVVRETKPLQKALKDYNEAKFAVQTAEWRMNQWRDKPATPGQMKRLVEKRTKAEAKYRKILAVQIAKSTKTRFIGGGWCAS